MSASVNAVGLDLPGGVRALDGVSITVARGEAVAIIGPSGAGKTSLLRIFAAALKPSSGSVKVLGLDPWHLDRRALRRLRGRIGLMHQSPPLPPRQRAVTAILAGKLPVWPLWKSLASLLYPMDIPAAHTALARLDLAEKLFERCDRLSGGQRQRVGLARLLVSPAELLLVDEPISAMDPQLAERAISELHAEAEKRGATLVASLHAVEVALRWFPRIIGLRAGRVEFDLPASELSRTQLHELYASETLAPIEVNEPASSDKWPRPICY